MEAVELPGVDHRAIARVGQLAIGVVRIGDDAPDRKAIGDREVMIASVMGGDRHDRAGAVLHQHVVGDVHRDLLLGDRICHRPAKRHSRLGLVGVAADLGRFIHRVVDVAPDVLLVRGAGGQRQDIGMFGGHHEEGRAEQGVRASREDRVVDPESTTVERDLRAGAAPDPVALHRLDVLRPVDRIEIVQQPVGVVGDLEEPLLQLPELDFGSAALAAAVDHLLVREDGLIVGAPLDGSLLAVGQAALEHPQEDPLGPAVVARIVGRELAGPVDADPPGAERPLESGDRLLSRYARVDSGPNRMVLRGQAERVVPHRVQHPMSGASMEVGDRVTERVVLQVSDVGLARRVGEHLADIGLRLLVGAGEVVAHLPGALAAPELLPLALDRVGFVATLSHPNA